MYLPLSASAPHAEVPEPHHNPSVSSCWSAHQYRRSKAPKPNPQRSKNWMVTLKIFSGLNGKRTFKWAKFNRYCSTPPVLPLPSGGSACGTSSHPRTLRDPLPHTLWQVKFSPSGRNANDALIPQPFALRPPSCIVLCAPCSPPGLRSQPSIPRLCREVYPTNPDMSRAECS